MITIGMKKSIIPLYGKASRKHYTTHYCTWAVFMEVKIEALSKKVLTHN